MADILIIGMEMPKTCSQCPLCYDYMMCSLRDGRFSHMGESFDCCEMRLADCPLVELPEHGDLIDRSELNNSFESSDFDGEPYDNVYSAICVVNSMPAIVPSNKEDAE